MGDMYLIDFSGDGEEAARREEERARVRARYAERLVRCAGVDEVTADLVLAALFDHGRSDGGRCPCGCHPQLPEGTLHDAGFDCSCTWDESRREAERRKWTDALEAHRASPEGQAAARAREQERAAIVAWIEAHPGVSAERTSIAAPEQWEGVVDGRSFYFRERHGEWRIELDLEPTGRFVRRVVGVDPDGEMVTEPVETTEGTVIADGLESALGQTATDHLEFIVRTIREHVTADRCPHEGALAFCPTCGARV